MPRGCWQKWSTPLFSRNDLRLLDARLDQIQHSPFFSEGLDSYLRSIRDVVARLLSNHASLPPELIRGITQQAWSATRYLSGSVSKEIPYEIVYGLERAMADWVPQTPKHIVTTAFVGEQQYYFESVSEQFYALTASTLGVDFDYRVVQIALPQLYRHQPLNNTVLYHELGHFVDHQLAISQIMAMLDGRTQVPAEAKVNHAAEHFADLFAACYVGDGISAMLENLAPRASISYTHPATQERCSAVHDFLSGRQNAVVDSCNAALQARGLPMLQLKFNEPALDDSFDSIRPYCIASPAEVHGILPAGYKYLERRLNDLSGMWINISEADAIRVVNDLVEKSIRNWMVRERWADARTV